MSRPPREATAMGARGDGFVWANSGDSHLIEPPGLFKALPEHIRERLPRGVKDPSGEFETIHVDGQSFRRDLPKPKEPGRRGRGLNARPVGTEEKDFVDRVVGGNDPDRRLRDLDDEGIWAEVIYPSLGTWSFNIRTPEVVNVACRALNEFALDFQSHSPRFVCCASVPLLDLDDAVDEVVRAREGGFAAAFLPTRPPLGRPDWHDGEWDRVFDRHPSLRVLVSEGGATWGPFIADRMDEGYRQHGAAVRPRLSKLPSSYLYEQVYASFQHDRSAVLANTAMGWRNVLWGSDYPHFEGTFGHTQKTLHELFDGVDADASRRIRLGAFQELFPDVPPAPAG